MYVPQYQLKNITNFLSFGKIVVVLGPRRSGKTTLLHHYLSDYPGKYLLLNAEDIVVASYLSSQSIEKLRQLIGDAELIAIDEAQKIQNIGINLKLIVDNFKVKVIATGSSAFGLSSSVGEPLTGRKFSLLQLPISQLELSDQENITDTKSKLPGRLVFGSYPEVLTTDGMEMKITLLKELVSSYLYKDILELDGIRHSEKIQRLLQLIAFQIGKEVSFTELGTSLQMSKNTTEKYLNLLEKSFVIFSLKGFSRNLRKEITKNSRYYFYDNGVRNAIINNFNPLEMRNDIGMLFENYIISERIKKQNYMNLHSNNYFWRTHDKKEIDFVEEYEGKLNGYEIKYTSAKAKCPLLWIETYKNSTFSVVTKENYLEFIK